MSSQSRLDIIFRTLKQGAGDKETMTAIQGVSGAFQALTGVSLVGAGAVTAIFGTMQRSISTTINLAAEIRTLSRLTGLQAEEASGLYQAADDVNLSMQSLTTGMRYAIDHGFQPSIENLAAMSDEYLSLENGADRTRYAIDHFGNRAGPEMAKLLGMGREAILNMVSSAEEAGQVFSGEALQSARDYEIAVDNLQDKFQGLSISFATLAIPLLTRFIEIAAQGVQTLNTLATASDRLHDVYDQHQQDLRNTQMSYSDYVAESYRAAQAAGLINYELRIGMFLWNQAAQGAHLTAQEQQLVNDTLRELGILTANQWEFKDSVRGTGIEAEALGNKFDETNDVLSNTVEPTLDLVNASFRDLTSEILYNRASAGLDGQAALELARGMGLVNESTYTSLSILQQLRERYDSNRDGAIDATEAAAGYTDEVLALGGAINALQNRTVTVTTIMQYINTYGWAYTGGADQDTASARIYHWGDGQGVSLGTEGPNALGDNFIVPSGYSESLGNPYLVAAQSGERVKITPAWQEDNGGGPSVVNVYLDSRLISQVLADRAHQQGVG
jgi:hypothetical protein